jgi:hypothetical protein
MAGTFSNLLRKSSKSFQNLKIEKATKKPQKFGSFFKSL